MSHTGRTNTTHELIDVSTRLVQLTKCLCKEVSLSQISIHRDIRLLCGSDQGTLFNNVTSVLASTDAKPLTGYKDSLGSPTNAYPLAM